MSDLPDRLDPEKLTPEQLKAALDGFKKVVMAKFNNIEKAIDSLKRCLQPPSNEEFTFNELKFMKYVIDNPDVLTDEPPA